MDEIPACRYWDVAVITEKPGARITARPHGAFLPLNSQPNFTVPEGA